MPSRAYQRWRTERASALDQIARAHAAVGGSGPGRRYATLQVNHAYAVMLAAQFQGYCRDLHTECVDHLVAMISHAPLQRLVRAEITRGRRLDQGNAQPASLGTDFGRLGTGLGTAFWDDVDGHDPRSATCRAGLESLNAWRNAVAHQDFDPSKLGGIVTLRLSHVKRWRRQCRILARSFDGVMRRRLQTLTGTAPW